MALVQLYLFVFNKYRLALSIPLDDCRPFSFVPLVWLSYVAYTIYGRSGHLSLTAGGPELNCRAVDIEARKYYYVSQYPGAFLDPDLMSDRTSTATTSKRGDFEQRVLDRDNTCVLTGSALTQACHIVPHAKGDQYMINVASNRPEEIVDPPLESIDDTRNGILLYPGFHSEFGQSRVAFLHTPNIVMDVYDVDRINQPLASQIHVSSHPEEKRLTFQHFPGVDPVTASLAPHNCDARISDDADWPSDIIFDVAYGIAALRAWGKDDFEKLIRSGVRKPAGENERAERAARRAKEKVGRQASDATQTPDLYDLILGLWMCNTRKDQQRAGAMRAERSRDKVQTWLDHVL